MSKEYAGGLHTYIHFKYLWVNFAVFIVHIVINKQGVERVSGVHHITIRIILNFSNLISFVKMDILIVKNIDAYTGD